MMKRLLGMLVAILLVFIPVVGVGASTADVTVNATPAYISISVAPTIYSFGVVQASGVTNTTNTTYFTVTNTATTVTTNNTISVNASAWASGGAGWTHSDTATAGDNTVGLEANKGGSWGTGDVVVKNADPLQIATNQTALTNWDFGLQLRAPTVFTDGQTNSILVTITAAYTG